MYSLKNDYSEGAHPSILQALLEKNKGQQEGYGEDDYCVEAATQIKKFFHSETSEVHFVLGGTQANLLVISALLRPHEAVIATETGHIFVHEAGAIEATGHRISTVKPTDGKLLPEDLLRTVKEHTDEHMVKPRMVFISNSSELGTVYSGDELRALRETSNQLGLYLYLDGARLANALAAGENLRPEDLARYTDVFYAGGTKNGLLAGEAILINHAALKKDFRFIMKQRGALLAKGRLMGVQFQALFNENLYMENARHANRMAQKIAKALVQNGYTFLSSSRTNQIFPVLPNGLIATLREHFDFYSWSKITEDKTAVRLVTSWATPEEAVTRFLEILVQYHS
ncbi:MAG: aminotransferase class I/II-fold pyridoxal phosphate-dependent enzyme [Bacteroidales bacterium]|nr:aminotransferase class I/II-fold pyridoxal phosphate-dependent enzyme [Bacteroidales bacterium]